jgi:hypothetical protein
MTGLPSSSRTSFPLGVELAFKGPNRDLVRGAAPDFVQPSQYVRRDAGLDVMEAFLKTGSTLAQDFDSADECIVFEIASETCFKVRGLVLPIELHDSSLEVRVFLQVIPRSSTSPRG